MDVFVADIFHQFGHYWIVGNSSGWDTLSNSGTQMKAGTGPAVVGRGDQRLLLSYTGSDNSVWMREYDFGWRPWTQILWANGTYVDGDVSAW